MADAGNNDASSGAGNDTDTTGTVTAAVQQQQPEYIKLKVVGQVCASF
jgi:ADP-ribosylglycohydrolase